MSQFRTIETIKQMETGSMNQIPKKADLTRQQLMPTFVTSVDNLGMKKLETPEDHLSTPWSQTPDKQQNATSEPEKDAILARHYETIEREMNQVPFMKYKKKELLLEKIILDRALEKV